MDSWTEKQLAIMRLGGNDKLNASLKSKGIGKRTPIKQKYENDHAQLYKEKLKARAEGRPEPTSLPPPKNKSAPSSMNRPMGGMGSNGMGSRSMGGMGSMGSQDPNGMERLAGESEQQYVARQTRLRDEARARMKSKFGGSGMGGVGSNPNYNPNGGGYGGGGYGVDNMVSGVSSAFSTGLSLVGTVANTAANSVNRDKISSVGGSVANVGGSFWSSLSSGISQVADTITAPDGNDGLSDLQRQFSSNRPAQSKYSGFGSDNSRGGNGGFNGAFNGGSNGGSSFNNGGSQFYSKPTIAVIPPLNTSNRTGEAPGLPGEDRNGIERLTGESDEQYVARQTRLRDEAKARMAAKFGGGGMGSASSASSYPPASSMSSSRIASAPASANFASTTRPNPAASPAPRSGGFHSRAPPRKMSSDNLSSDER